MNEYQTKRTRILQRYQQQQQHRKWINENDKREETENTLHRPILFTVRINACAHVYEFGWSGGSGRSSIILACCEHQTSTRSKPFTDLLNIPYWMREPNSDGKTTKCFFLIPQFCCYFCSLPYMRGALIKILLHLKQFSFLPSYISENVYVELFRSLWWSHVCVCLCVYSMFAFDVEFLMSILFSTAHISDDVFSSVWNSFRGFGCDKLCVCICLFSPSYRYDMIW